MGNREHMEKVERLHPERDADGGAEGVEAWPGESTGT
jgi:hypothetical protein